MRIDQFYSLFEADKLVSEFADILKSHGIEIIHDSQLERLCLNIVDVLEKHLKPQLRDPKEDIRILFREYAGMQDLMVKIVKAKDNVNFQLLIPHLKKLNIAIPLQNIQTSVRNQANNKVSELFIATLCLGLNTQEIHVDDPNQSKGDNPDVIAMIDGKMWGFGCKALYSLHPQTVFENIEKAVDQIEKSPARIGIPVLNIKNIVDHDKFWPIVKDGDEPEFGAFLDVNMPASMMISFVKQIHQDLVDHVGEENLKEIFKNKKSQPGCFVYCPTTTSVVINFRPVTTRLNMFDLMHFDNVSKECLVVMRKLNHQLQLTK